jgi:4-hydroxybenzoate polyprenyltransferase
MKVQPGTNAESARETNSGLAFRLQQYASLMRLDRPIGSILLLAPTLWGVWVATSGRPSAHLLFVFVLGVFVMRSAGCVMNDLADREFDPHVERTRDRPLAAGTVRVPEAILLCLTLCAVALILLLTLPTAVIKYAIAAIFVTICYPFVKRFVHTPQVVLGMAFSFGIPMAFAAEQGHVPLIAWLLVLANMFWTIAYDTEYAMSDREDDLKIGVKSTAILLAERDRTGVAVLHLLTVVTLAGIGYALKLNAYFYVVLAISTLTLVYQHHLIRNRERTLCFKAFLNNAWFGLLVWGGLVLGYLDMTSA